MKQSSINSFTEGLTYDLNPLTTPNNVLTDCVNGTFLTFNGDEMSLQNDAGNTKILVPGTTDEYVELDEGYYPIGMKEYGGVLYIVSAYTPTDTSVEFVKGNSYLEGAYVYNTAKEYYKSKQDNTEPLPLFGESDEYWELIGNFTDYINSRSNIQFGSYPSPESSGVTESDGVDVNKTHLTIDDLFYQSVVINNEVFKSGRYIVFKDLINNITHISGYSDSATYDPRFYKIKLWHQLTNGYVDLTDNIWREYRTFKGSGISNSYWFDDATFKYYCPHQYKGKLSLSVEIEELKDFAIRQSPDLVYSRDNIGSEYELTFYTTVEEYGDLKCPQVSVDLILDGVTIGTDIRANVNSGVAEFVYTFPVSARNKLLNFIVKPVIEVSGSDITSDLPQEYLDKFTLNRFRIISTEFDYVVFKPTGQECSGDFGVARYTSMRLEDESGNYLGTNLSYSSPDQYFFVKNGATPPINASGDNYIIAYYDIVDFYPVVTKPTELTINPIVLNMFENTYLGVESFECGAFLGINDSEDLFLINDLGDKIKINN